MKKMMILGGGTAGWMAANLLVKHLDPHLFEVCLVESPHIGTIGVGEGSTPHLKVFFDELGISEAQWMPQCKATYKNGISFLNWSEVEAHERYFHPFPSAIDRQTLPAFLTHCHLKFQGCDVETRPDSYFLASTLSQNNKSPINADVHRKHALNYAYHFDSHLLGEYLKKLAIQAGVTHIQARVDNVTQDSSNAIAGLILDDGSCLNADFFVDASGFTGQLIQQSLQVPFESFGADLLNDSAIAIPSAKLSPMPSETRATALKYGWAWQIPLQARTGNGYVFSSQHCSFSQAEDELREHLHAQGESKLSQGEARHIHMKVGMVKQAWQHNVLAIGLAQGFIEPLEATALHLVLDSLIGFISAFEQGKNAENEQVKARFNETMRKRYYGIKDYIVCHYKVNTRSDTKYWQEVREQISASEQLEAVLEAWDNKQDITPILHAHGMDKYYPAVSWYCLLSGYGRFPTLATQQRKPHLQAQQGLQQVKQYLQKSQTSFLPHEVALERLVQD